MALNIASADGHVEIVKLLLESGADMNIQRSKCLDFNREPLELLSQAHSARH
jgi:ankyrin repeat protein